MWRVFRHKTWRCRVWSCSGGFWYCFGPEFPHYAPFSMFWNDNVYPVPLYVGNVIFFFYFDFFRGLQLKDCMNLSRDFELWNLKHC